MKRNLLVTIVIVFFVGLTAFKTYDYYCVQLPEQSYNYAQIILPPDVVTNLPTMDNMDSTNITSDAGATLGRVLFYDVDLSQNHTIACASCHIQEFSFSDTVRFSKGFNGGLTGRNSMSLNHARFHTTKNFFWDERATSLEMQVLMPIKDGVEMGLTLDTLVARISAKAIYPPLFQAAYGSPAIDTTGIAKALAQFIRSMNTYGSRYRQGLDSITGSPATTPFPNFTAEENEGKRLFMDATRINCQGCHMQNMFVSRGVQNTGLDSILTDRGAGAITGDSTKDGKFRVPSLINIALTGPYMHDGRYKTLEEVIDFYSDSIHNHPNLNVNLRDTITGLPKRPHYSAQEKKALKAFMLTLTDTLITTDERWSNPFCASSIPTGIAEVKPMLYSKIYPNPLPQGAALQMELIAGGDFQGHIRVFDVTGRLVCTRDATVKTGNNHLDIRGLNCAPGTYILNLAKSDKVLLTKKFVVN